MYYDKYPLCHSNSDAKGESSRSLEAEDRFGGLQETSVLTSLGRVAFVVGFVLLLILL